MILFLLSAALVSAPPQDITPRVSIVQIFGAHKSELKKIEKVARVAPGDPVPHSDELESRFAKVPGTTAVTVSPICCYNNGIVLYIGVEEKGSRHTAFHPAPDGAVTLPQRLYDKYEAVMAATEASMHARNADEDLTNGYSLLADPAGRELQGELLPMVAENFAAVDDVLRHSSDPDQRQAAAYLTQYAPRAPHEIPKMLDALQYAIQDPEPAVRSAAIAAINAVAVGARLHPAQHIHIEPTWLVELMNSTVWSDRHQASLALVTLTDKANWDTLQLLRQRALDSVCDMALWQDLEHALPGFVLAGRIAGMDQKRIEDAWVAGERDSVIADLRKRH